MKKFLPLKKLLSKEILFPFLTFLIIGFIDTTASAQFGTSPWTAANGTYTIPAGVTSITVECWGGGGGGGGARESGLVSAAGGGGGGGANAITTSFPVTPGQTITVTNGAAGTAGSSAPTAGGAGGTSSVVYNATATTVASAAGGNGGNPGSNSFGVRGTGGTTGTGTIHNGGNGATGSGGPRGGGGGGSGGNTTAGSAAVQDNGGAAGTTNGAMGGDGGVTNDPGNAPGSPGNAPGGGGGAGSASDFNNQIARSAAGGAGGAGRVIITYSVVACTPPSTQATGPITFGNITGTSLDYAFTRGNGDNVMVVCRAGSAVSPGPVDGTSYTANPIYGTGTAIGGGFCVYNGTAAGINTATGNITISGLTCYTTYHFAVYEYNTTGTCYSASALTGNTATTCSAAPAAPVATAATGITTTSFTANWTASSCATGYRIDVATDNTFVNYVPGYQDLNAGNTLSYNVTGLTQGTTYYYRVRAYNTCGTSTSSGTILATTLAVPVVLSFTPDSACAGSGVFVGITGTGFSGATTVSFNGTPASFFTVDNNAQITATLPGSATTGTISVTGPNGTGTSSSNFTVNPLPVATPTPVSQSVCSGSSTFISLSSSVPGSAYSWSRNTPLGISGTMPVSGSADPTGTLISSVAAAVTVTFTITPSANGCTGNAVTADVEVQPVPGIPGSITGPDTACSGSSNPYSVSPATGATSYTWTLPNGWGGNSTSTTINTMAGSAGGNISVVANNSCGSSSAQTLAVNILTIPAAPGTISGPNPICSGSSNTYSAVPVAGASSYTWTLPNGWTGNSTTENINTTAGSTGGDISVIANNGCGSSSPLVLIVSAEMTPSSPGIISGPDSLCAGASGSFTISPVSGATGYVWTLPGGWTGSSTTENINAFAGTAGGDISVTAGNSCGSSSAQSKSVTVNPLPLVTFSFTQNPVCTNASPVVLNSGSPAGGTYTGAGVSSGTFDPSQVSPGTYTILYDYTDAFGCSASDTADITVSICSGIANQDNENAIKVYPNPFNNELSISLNTAFEKGNIILRDVTGREVSRYELPSGIRIFNVNTESLVKGVYQLEVTQGENKKVYSVIKEN